CVRAGLSQVAILDSQEFPHTVTGLTGLLEQRLGSWPPTGPGPVGIAIDGFDQMADMEWRFREGFLRSLEGPVLVVLAGRGRGTLVEPASGWETVVEDLPLREFTAAESDAYLDAQGIHDRTAIRDIVGLTQGNPLA